MKRRLFGHLTCVLALIPACGSAASLTSYVFLTDTGPSGVDPDVFTTVFEPGAAITSAALTDNGQPLPSWSVKNWTTSSDSSDALESDSYVWFRITPDPGTTMTLTGITIDVRPHGSGPDRFAVSVVDVATGFGSRLGGDLLHSDQSTIADGFKTWETLSAASDLFEDLTGTFEIRIYGYDAKQADSEVLFDNVHLVGVATQVPEASIALLLAPSAILLAWRRRFRPAP